MTERLRLSDSIIAVAGNIFEKQIHAPECFLVVFLPVNIDPAALKVAFIESNTLI